MVIEYLHPRTFAKKGGAIIRNILFWVGALVIVVLALSATVSMATVRWLYPNLHVADPKPVVTTKPKPQALRVPEPTVVQRRWSAVKPLYEPPVFTPPPSKALSADEAIAIELIRAAAAGDLKTALGLSVGVSQSSLTRQLTQFAPIPYRAGTLPSEPGKPVNLLVWATYRRDGESARGAYQVSVSGGKIVHVNGPLAPDEGYAPLPWEPLDEQARKIDLSLYRGRGLVLISPRAPEPGLLDAMAHIHKEYKEQGVEVVLVLDIRSPDWIGTARNGGFLGPVWRIKGRIEDVPVVSPGRMLGASGLLIDPEGLAVASLSALDPSRYGVHERGPLSIASGVFRAYGLLP